jgi:hypothetical protein
MEYSIYPFDIDISLVQGGVGAELLNPQPRSPGWHLSEIVGDMINRVKHNSKRKAFGVLDEDEQQTVKMRWETGFIWEVVVEMVWRERRLTTRSQFDGVIRQPELESDGIFMTPDGLRVQDRKGNPLKNWVEEEYKATWRSARRLDAFEDDFGEWLISNKSYCRASKTNLAEFFVLFINGDYKPMEPFGRRVEVSYTQRDLDENWDMVLRHRDLMNKEGKKPKRER